MVFWLPLRQSRWLCRLRRLQSSCAVLALWHVDWPLAVQLVVLLSIVLYARRKTALPQALLFDTHGLQLLLADEQVSARLGAHCYCSEYLVVLSFRLEQELPSSRLGRRQRLILLPDSSTADALRKLRVYLRWRAQGLD